MREMILGATVAGLLITPTWASDIGHDPINSTDNAQKRQFSCQEAADQVERLEFAEEMKKPGNADDRQS